MQTAVLGAGSMGHGIAQVLAMAGHDVTMRDVDDERVADGVDTVRSNLQKGVELGKVSEAERDATLGRLTGETDLDAAVGDAGLVVEAVPESMDLKQSVFEEVDAAAPGDCLLATNTSSLSVTELASSVSNPERFVGAHFFNPPHLMDLVEVIRAEQTADETETRLVEMLEDAGKTCVVVEDFPGFATSRLGVAIGAEAIRMVEQGVADPAAIDRAMVEGYNFPVGPLELTDRVGLDVRLHILQYLREELGERFRPPALLKRKVRAGKLGVKSGEGFYRWEDGGRVDTE
ncbi:3-hydroxyacyl-CoA dehydrogenase family protein [Halomarina oriensis]|uniref:3-hydroxybutyryl-CoA dehydrogenase n=1 Tax=Halomarina oriensis TaxID=671145 RepID=A0A6B0GFY6_9EURY|nr:3-hydroxyacyl-CoA dehydrogenase family protein [Halomarina oriensis]MWG33614.1 3-hydroxybutyryl-CoA dehydrogenase [Halomarina oriensis]